MGQALLELVHGWAIVRLWVSYCLPHQQDIKPSILSANEMKLRGGIGYRYSPSSTIENALLQHTNRVRTSL